MRVTWRLRAVVLAGLVIGAAGACGPKTRHAVLSVFFDGVEEPTPPSPVATTDGAPPGAGPMTPVASHADVSQAQLDEAAAEPPKPRPALESVYSWSEVVAALPRDSVGGVDWVKALGDGLIEPRAEISLTAAPRTPPFTLATLGPSMSSGTTPPFDLTVDIEPVGAPFYNVPFPHASHTLWLNCSSCHPGIAGKRPGMQAILRGEFCGTCHGKVSFAPETACGRCHVRLEPAEESTVTGDLARARTETAPSTPERVAEGARLYQSACAVCHGEKGDGGGPFASALPLKPRDLTRGSYRFRSTPMGTLPTDWDLFRTITIGVPLTLMPAFSGLTFDERMSLVAFVKSLSPRFAAEPAPEPVVIPPRPAFTATTVAHGKEMYAAICVGCHGEKGDGKGPAADLRDEGGDPVPPFDFTRGRAAKSGGTPEDLYRVLVTGIEGTPMGPFGAGSSADDNWALVSYLWSLGEANRGKPHAVGGEIRFARSHAAPPGAGSSPAPGPTSAEPPSGAPGPPLPAPPSPGATNPLMDGNFPPAVFPHWFHRIRFRCSACHPSVFEMKAGANSITMDAMRSGRFCGACHAGQTAWQIGFETCFRCHLLP